MIVYGDASRVADPAEIATKIAAGLGNLETSQSGIERHGHLVGLLIAAGELAQGLADAEFFALGVDQPSVLRRKSLDLVLWLARAVERSWAGDLGRQLAEAKAVESARLLAGLVLPHEVTIKLPEGFAHYALYPEAYGIAASPLKGASATIIGIRSIGVTLAGVVAAAIEKAPVESSVVDTVRPIGHPFQRSLALDAQFTAALREHDQPFAIVDEGPGLSGSSFGVVADAIEASGPADIHFFPSHAGEPGPEASERHRLRWSRAARHTASFESVILQAKGARRLDVWFADLVGEPVAPLIDMAGGAWRRRIYGDDERRWPPANPTMERRKFLLETKAGFFLLKFAGLGGVGDHKFEAARRLAESGFVIPPLAFRHGFIIEPWHDAFLPLDRASLDDPFVKRVGHYLAFRCRAFPAPKSSGASLAALFEMTRHNTVEALGTAAGRCLNPWQDKLERLQSHVHRIETDNRLQVWEWLDGSGVALKADALDHHCAHDLVGCQDVAWDIAGAAIEYDLDASRRDRLSACVEQRSGRSVDPDLVSYFELCYLAFQLGSWTMAAKMAAGSPEEHRLQKQADRYAFGLRARIS